MIINEQQYRLTEEQVAKFEQALEQATTNPDKSLHPLLQQAQVAALQSQLADLRADMAAYEVRHADHSNAVKLSSLAELPQTLIKARVAAGFTHRDLAKRLGVTELEMQRYEATAYADVRFIHITAVAEALGLGTPTVIFLATSAQSEPQPVS